MGNLKTAYPYSGFITATAPVPTSFYPQMQWEMLWLKAMRERFFFFFLSGHSPSLGGVRQDFKQEQRRGP